MTRAHERFLEFKRLRNAEPVQLDPHTTGLVVIDMQEYFLNPESPFSRLAEGRVPGVLDYFQSRAHTVVVQTLRRLLDVFRAHGLRVVYTTVASERSDGTDLMPIFQRMNAVAREQIGEAFIPPRTDPWARIVAGLEPCADELVVNKTTYGTFNSTGFDHTLRSLGIETLVIGGVVTNACVETTARDAADRGYQVILVDDAWAAYSPEIHEATLVSFMGSFGRVRTADEVLALLERALPVALAAQH